jgi:hypothetical protein
MPFPPFQMRLESIDGRQSSKTMTSAGKTSRHGFTALPAVNTFQTHLERRERHINAMLAEARQDTSAGKTSRRTAGSL